MNFNLFLQKTIQKDCGLDLKITKISDRDRNNVYVGTNSSKKYFIKFEKYSDAKLWTEIYKLSRKINLSKFISTSQFILTRKNTPFVLSKEVNKIIILFKWENLKSISINKDFSKIIKGIAEFHSIFLNTRSKFIRNSRFGSDFMFGDIPKVQSKDKLKQILSFYKNYSPDYSRLTKGIIHNDLHVDNIAKTDKRIFLTDFEHIKFGPLVSDIGVLILDFWKNNAYKSYSLILKRFLYEYTKTIKLSKYDLKCIILFSIRYLYSDYNYFTYFNKKSGKYKKEILETENRLKTLLNTLSKK